eukprot:TRINITY_DN2323_c0_g1_i4.p2 TRINITY_DN2323_c0_g1~~TRINITY_DN2323_c0_g1_i4.p2  ORF type:complete len:220 (-),score=67.47 TRINITY_DN2323_c0_g1_i4:32-691(-)
MDEHRTADVARALYDYHASTEYELSFNKGDELYILDEIAGGWLRGEKDGQFGLIPASFIRRTRSDAIVASGPSIDSKQITEIKRAIMTLKGQSRSAIQGMLARIDEQQKQQLKFLAILRDLGIKLTEEKGERNESVDNLKELLQELTEKQEEMGNDINRLKGRNLDEPTRMSEEEVQWEIEDLKKQLNVEKQARIDIENRYNNQLQEMMMRLQRIEDRS